MAKSTPETKAKAVSNRLATEARKMLLSAPFESILTVWKLLKKQELMALMPTLTPEQLETLVINHASSLGADAEILMQQSESSSLATPEEKTESKNGRSSRKNELAGNSKENS